MEEFNIPKLAALKSIIIKNTTKRRLPLTQSALRSCARDTFRFLRKEPSGVCLGVNFFSDSRIKKLNQRYFKTNAPTDVIAFSYSKENADIAISLDTAERNAGIFKSSLKKEILLYVIHGILHLNGYDDTTPKEKKRMFKKQEEILKKLSSRQKPAPVSIKISNHQSPISNNQTIPKHQ